MKEASDRLDFERAAQYRDMLESVRYISQKQKITNSDMQDKDIVQLPLMILTVLYRYFL